MGALAPLLLRAAENAPDEKLPTVRQITKGPRFHWFGYYDKFQFSQDHRFVLSNEVDFEGRSPRADDMIRIGMVDLEDGDKWIELGNTTAWNWQQGCMLQWVPGSDHEIIWNDCKNGRFVAHVLNVKTSEKRTFPHPVYSLSPDGRSAITPDFRRLNDCRPGYGYTGIPDPNLNVLKPADSGVWSMDMKTGEQELLFSFADIAAIPFTGKPDSAPRPDDRHWFNHLLFNTDSTRFFFLHRWAKAGPAPGPFRTRAFTADRDGKNIHCIDPHGDTSHFIWRDPRHVMAWAWHPSHSNRFYLYEDKTDRVMVVGANDMTENGHNTYVPGRHQEWVLNDTYPDKNRLQHPYLYHIPTRRKLPLGHFTSPPAYTGEWRCDTHPRISRDGTQVCIDSPHNGGRQLFLIDVRSLLT
ncbi:MAG: hypothetical protein V4584_03850 [Verrucomicrobiota bacterium]